MTCFDLDSLSKMVSLVLKSTLPRNTCFNSSHIHQSLSWPEEVLLTFRRSKVISWLCLDWRYLMQSRQWIFDQWSRENQWCKSHFCLWSAEEQCQHHLLFFLEHDRIFQDSGQTSSETTHHKSCQHRHQSWREVLLHHYQDCIWILHQCWGFSQDWHCFCEDTHDNSQIKDSQEHRHIRCQRYVQSRQ